MKVSATLDNACVSKIEQSGSYPSLSPEYLTNWKVCGVDATNAFAEALSPVAPLHASIDESCLNWYEKPQNLGKMHVGNNLHVKQALQGHLESPRL